METGTHPTSSPRNEHGADRAEGTGRPDAARPRGLLLVGHGTREPAGIAQFLELADRVAGACPELAVEPCFLELAEPEIRQGVARLAARKVEELTVAPLLLFSAGHAKQDIPAAVAAAIKEHPALRLLGQAPHLGCHPAILKLSQLRYEQAIAALAGIPPEETLLVMVGRGSRDAEATAEMRQFTRLRAEASRVGGWETCFLAMASPPIAEVLPRAAEQGLRRVVVQPHLLFEGLLFGELRAMVSDAQARWPKLQWVLADPLGPHPLLVEAVLASGVLTPSGRQTTIE